MTTLREQFKRDLSIKGFSDKTQSTYLRHVIAFSKFHDKSPDLLGTEEIKDYLHYIITEKNISKSYVNQVYSGLKFFYETTLNRDWDMKSIPRTKKIKKLPLVLSKEEVKRILESNTNLKHRALLTTIYSAGLRVSEAVNLKIADIDSDNMLIKVNEGKGGKDRFTILSGVTLDILRDYFKYYKPNEWLFPGADKDKPITTRTVERVMENSVNKAKIKKRATVHTLRHSFATHLLENGTDIYYIQKLLGHTNISTTSIYLHVSNMKIKNIKSPMDTLEDDQNE